MLNIYKISIHILLKVILLGLMLITQGCSNSDLVIDKNLQQGTGKNSNRRAPVGNVQEDQQPGPLTDNTLKRADKDYDVYQNYQANNPPVSLSDLKKSKRHPVLNARELGTTRKHKTAKKKAKTPHVDGNCNLKEVIDYNKAQQKSSSTGVAASTVAAVKAPEAAETGKPVTAAPVTNPVPIAPAVVAPSNVNQAAKAGVKPVTKVEAKDQQTTSKQAILPKVSLPELKSIKQKAKESSESKASATIAPVVVSAPVVANSPVVATTSTSVEVSNSAVKVPELADSAPTPTPATKASSTTVSSVAKDQVSPANSMPAADEKPIIKNSVPPAKSVLVPIPGATSSTIPATTPVLKTAPTPAPVPDTAAKPVLTPPPLSSVNLKATPPAPPVQPTQPKAGTTKDVGDLSQSDLEKMLKEKFAKDRPKEFIDDSQVNPLPPVQFNKNLLNEDELNEDVVQSSGTSQAVSKIRALYQESRLSKINTVLIGYYFQVKHKIISLFFDDDA